MRATLQTRQAQLLMQIYDRVNNKDFTRDWAETNYFWKWTDDEDYWKKYGANLEEYPKLKSVIDTYEGIGAILENKLVDPKMIYGVLRADPILYWEKFSPLMKKFAERAGESLMYPGFELLCDEMRRRARVKLHTLTSFTHSSPNPFEDPFNQCSSTQYRARIVMVDLQTVGALTKGMNYG